MRYLKGLVLLLVISLTSCSEKKDISIEKAAIYFNSISPEKSGLDFSNTLHPKDNLNIIEYLYYYNGGGVAVGDINNDGLDDVYFTANQSPDRLYLNLGGLKFKDITEFGRYSYRLHLVFRGNHGRCEQRWTSGYPCFQSR